jgi:pyruvate/2-oxoglutarate/acetoin dehydrogenase E1 component
MKYIELVNNLLKNQVSKHEQLVIFGQNVSAGSCIGGMTKGLSIPKSGRIINSTNSENSLCGFGFGMMINEISSIFFMKQLDFLLLGIDHLVNTFNLIRNHENNASFTIFPIVMDNGYQGLQSSSNNFSDFCSIARIKGYSITNKIDAEKIISSELVSPGFRIIAISQRMFKDEVIVPNELIYVNEENDVFQYSVGDDVTVVCFNFSFPYGQQMVNMLKEKNLTCSFFNINSPTPTNWRKIIDDVHKTKKIIIIDDSKSENLNFHTLLTDISDKTVLDKKIILKRNMDKIEWLNPIDDQMNINFEQVVNDLIG